MQENVAESVARKSVGQPGRKKKTRANEAIKCGRVDFATLDDHEGSAHPHFGFAIFQQFENCRVSERTLGADSPRKAECVEGDEGKKKGNAAKPNRCVDLPQAHASDWLRRSRVIP